MFSFIEIPLDENFIAIDPKNLRRACLTKMH